jgi:hypothetical protein
MMSVCVCLRQEFPGEPDAGNLHVRFEEGEGSLHTERPSLLYREKCSVMYRFRALGS